MVQGEAHQVFDLGRRLRELREERDISMRALARMSGLSANALSMIERNLTSPSVSTLTKLAHALEVPITALFHTVPIKKRVVYYPIGEQSKIEIKAGMLTMLGGNMYIGKINPFLLHAEKGAHSGQNGLFYNGDQFIICLSGKLEYTVNGIVYTLSAGDVLLFDASLGHHWRNPVDEAATALIVLGNYSEDEGPGEYQRASMENN